MSNSVDPDETAHLIYAVCRSLLLSPMAVKELAVHQIHSEQGSTLEGKKLLPWGANSFLLQQTLVLEGGQYQSERVTSPESVSMSLNQ